MAIAPVTNGLYNNTSASSSIAVSMPSGWSPGNFALLLVVGYSTTQNTASITPVSGWTTIRQAEGMWLGYRFLQSGDAGWTATGTNISTIGVNLTLLSGVDTSNPIDTFGFAHMRGQGPQGYAGGVSPPVNPSYTNDYLVHVCGCNYGTNTTPTAPSGWTGIGAFNGANVAGRCSGLQATSAATTAQVTAGTTTMASGGFAFSGIVALKTAGATPVAPSASFPYLAATISGFASGATTSAPIVAAFHDVCAPGDLMLVHIVKTDTAAPTPPSGQGWNSLALNSSSYLFYRTAQSGDPQSFNFTVSATCYAICHAQVVKVQGVVSGQTLAIEASGLNSAAASTTTPSTPALTTTSTTDLLLTRIDNNSATSSTIAYHASGSNFEDMISYFGPNTSLGHLCNSPNPTPTAYGTKSVAATGTDTAIALAIKLSAAPIAAAPQQMFLT